MLNSKYIFFYSWILISLNVVITKDQLSGDNKTNLVFMMKPIITRETEREQRAESSRHDTGFSLFLLWLSWSRVTGIINNDGREDFLSRPNHEPKVDTFSIFSFSNLIHSLVTSLERKYIVRTKLYNFVRCLTYFVNFLKNIFPIFIFWYKHLIKSWMFTHQIFFYPENAIQSFKRKLLSMTYWYSKLLQNIVAQFQPRKLCQKLIYFSEAIFSFKLLLLTPSISPRNLRTFKVLHLQLINLKAKHISRIPPHYFPGGVWYSRLRNLMFLYIRQNLIIVSKKWVWRRTFGLKVRLDQIKKPADVPLVTTRVGVSPGPGQGWWLSVGAD